MSNITKFKFLPLPRFWPQKEAVLRLDQNFCVQSKPLYSRECPHEVWWFGTQYQKKIKHLSVRFRLTSATCIPITLFRRPLENQDPKQDFMLSGANFMYIYHTLVIIRVIKSQRGSKLAQKVCFCDIKICSDPDFNSKNHIFQFAFSKPYVGLRRWNQHQQEL